MCVCATSAATLPNRPSNFVFNAVSTARRPAPAVARKSAEANVRARIHLRAL